MEKTAMQQLRENIELSNLLGESAKLIVCAFVDNHVYRERQQITDAWMAGNKEGWAMSTDHPEDAVKYYNETFTP